MENISEFQISEMFADSYREPFVKIVEEPAHNLYRFRYGSEGESAGAIPGEKQHYGGKSFPKISLQNYEGKALLEVCCLTEDFKTHPNKLVWKKARGYSEELVQAGVYRTEIRGNRDEEIVLGVNLSKKSDVLNLISAKQELGVDPFGQGFTHAQEEARIKLELTRIRLCFKVSIREDPRGTWIPLPPVCSRVIQHNKQTNRDDLRIIDISDSTSFSCGGEKKIIICEKLEPSGIQLVFYDEQSDWSGLGVFGPGDVHHRSSVVFMTPAYPGLAEVTRVKLEIRNYNGQAASKAIDFTYYPEGGYRTIHDMAESNLQGMNVLQASTKSESLHSIDQQDGLPLTITSGRIFQPSDNKVFRTYTTQDILG